MKDDRKHVSFAGEGAGQAPLDLSRVRAQHGLGALQTVTVTATDLAEMGFCEMKAVLGGLYPDERRHPALEERRLEGLRVHAERNTVLERQLRTRRTQASQPGCSMPFQSSTTE